MPERPRVAVVTGGALGIGAAIAKELGAAGMHIIVVDPGVTMDGAGEAIRGGTSTVDRIARAGGSARLSKISVTDTEAVQSLFDGLVEEFGAIEAVVNVAGILRPTGFGRGAEEDWRAVLEVHLDGYLNILRAALPGMVAVGRGQIVGVTSGAGWRQSDSGAYGCAKRAVAAVTWQLGRLLPPGVSLNALSPIAATRMVAGALSRPGGPERAAGRDVSTGAVALGNARPPEDLGPIGAFLAGRDFGDTCSGEVISSNGTEISRIVGPALMEIVYRYGSESRQPSLDDVVPSILAVAEDTQVSSGGSTPRLASRGGEPSGTTAPPVAGHVLLVSDGHPLTSMIRAALRLRGTTCSVVAPANTFEQCSRVLASEERSSGAVDAVIVLPTVDAAIPGGPEDAPAWQRFLDEHMGASQGVLADAAWGHAVAESSARSGRKTAVLVIVDATTSGGRSRSQAVAQLSRGGRISSSGRINAFALSLESRLERALMHATELSIHLVTGHGTEDLSGAELVVAADWLGLRAHPRPAATVAFDGPQLPDLLTGTLRDLVLAAAPASR